MTKNDKDEATLYIITMNKRLWILITTLAVFLLQGRAVVAETRLTPPPNMPTMEVRINGTFYAGMDYVNGTMKLTDQNGQVVEMPAKFKMRGATASSYNMKPSLNMKLRDASYTEEVDSALLGMRSCSSWILDAMANDRICMRNRVAFDIWNDYAHLPYPTQFESRNGTEGRFVEVYINNTYYGIYCLSDRINRKLLDLKKVKEEENGTKTVRGVLYKSGTQEIPNQNEPCYNEDMSACVVEYHNAWELTYPENMGSAAVWAPLQDAILNGTTPAYIKKYFWLENMADYHLHVMALCIVDNWGNKNHFFSVRNITKNINDTDTAEANKRKFVLTPWDLDTSLGGSYDGSNYNGNYTDWPVTATMNKIIYPFWPMYQDGEYLLTLMRRWREVRTYFTPDSVNAKLERNAQYLISSGAWDRMVNHFEGRKGVKPCYVTDLGHEIQCIEAWYAQRFKDMDAYFGTTPLENVPAAVTDEAYYDVLGRRLGDTPPAAGCYIHKGKVVVIGQ